MLSYLRIIYKYLCYQSFEFVSFSYSVLINFLNFMLSFGAFFYIQNLNMGNISKFVLFAYVILTIFSMHIVRNYFTYSQKNSIFLLGYIFTILIIPVSFFIFIYIVWRDNYV